jgi:hypothetical protein
MKPSLSVAVDEFMLRPWVVLKEKERVINNEYRLRTKGRRFAGRKITEALP